MKPFVRSVAMVCWVLAAAGVPAQLVLHAETGGVFNARLGANVRAAGDVNHDGVPDVIALAEGGTGVSAYVDVFSGSNGAVLRHITGTQLGRGIGAAGDVNADLFADLIVGSWQQVTIRSGASGSVLRIINSPNGEHIEDEVLGLGDVSGDGVPDIATIASDSGNARAWSGANGTLLWTRATGIFNDQPAAANVGDIDGDGRNDLVVGDFGNGTSGFETGRVTVISGANGFVIRTITPSAINVAPHFGWSVAALGDFNADGVPDFAVGAPDEQDPVYGSGTGAVYVISGINGGVLRHWYGGPQSAGDFGAAVALAGDLNLDGFKDIAVGASTPLTPHLRILSGANGSDLMRVDGAPSSVFASQLASLGDVNGDGFGDLAVGARDYTLTAVQQGQVQVLSGRIYATATPVGSGCGAGPFYPGLAMSRPVLGQPVIIVGDRVPLGTAGILFASAAPAFPTELGFPGCVAWVSGPSATPVATVPTAGSSWSVVAQVPLAGVLAGLQFAFQAAYFPTNGPLGFDLSNAVIARVGY